MSIRPSFIATRINGVECYHFAHDPRAFSIHPQGSQFVAYIGFSQTSPATRRDCVATIMEEALFSF